MGQFLPQAPPNLFQNTKPPIKEWVCELCSSKQSTVLYLCKQCGNPQFGKKDKKK